jgi:hypothetical protein
MDEYIDKLLDEMTFEETEPDQESPEPETPEFPLTIVPEFYKIIEDFVADIQLTFPEYTPIIQKWWNPSAEGEEKDAQCKFVFQHCLNVLPPKIFDILQSNPKMFEKESTDNTEFLPNIIFKYLWNSDISENSRNAIWKYLQAILNAITASMKVPGFEENIFKNFNQEEMGAKLEETMKTVHSLFDKVGEGGESGEGVKGIQEHFQEMTKGKIGKLAFEMAEETAKSLNLDEDVTTTQDMFSNLMKNPGKLMNIVQSMGSKLDERMKAGDIDENEILNEGMEMLGKMKDIPGFGDLSKMFSNFENLIPKDLSNAQMGAMQTKLGQNKKKEDMKKRMNQKLNKKREAKKDEDLEKIENIKKLLQS